MKLIRALHSSLKKGEFVRVIRTISQADLDAFSSLTGDHNQIHKRSDDNNNNNRRPIIHGALLNGIVAGIIGTQLPGQGSVVVAQNLSFPSKCFVGEPIEFYVELIDVRKIIKVHYKCSQNGSTVFEGDAKLVMNKSSE